MTELREAVDEFLSCRRIAVAGVSRSGGEAANHIGKKLRGAGYEVFAINPKADEIEGETCYRSLADVPGGVEAVVAATHPDATVDVVRECAKLGIRRVWMHRSFGGGSVSDEAVSLCHEHGISVIPGGCPMMYCEPVDVGHRCIRWILSWTGGLPDGSRYGAPGAAAWIIALALVAAGCSAPAPDDIPSVERPAVEFLTSPEYAEMNLPFSEAVRVDNILFLSGQVGNRPGTFELVDGGIEPEARQTLENIRAALDRYGSSL